MPSRSSSIYLSVRRPLSSINFFSDQIGFLNIYPAFPIFGFYASNDITKNGESEFYSFCLEFF